MHTEEFAVWVSVMILANAALIGVTEDILIKRSTDAQKNEGVVSMNDGAIIFFEIFFSAAFAVELLLRLLAHEGRYVNLRMMRILRVLRIFRTLGCFVSLEP